MLVTCKTGEHSNMIRKLIFPALATVVLAGCATSYQYRGGSGDYYYGQPTTQYRYYGSPGYGYSSFGVYGAYGVGNYGYPYYYGYPGYYGNPYYRTTYVYYPYRPPYYRQGGDGHHGKGRGGNGHGGKGHGGNGNDGGGNHGSDGGDSPADGGVQASFPPDDRNGTSRRPHAPWRDPGQLAVGIRPGASAPTRPMGAIATPPPPRSQRISAPRTAPSPPPERSRASTTRTSAPSATRQERRYRRNEQP